MRSRTLFAISRDPLLIGFDTSLSLAHARERGCLDKNSI
jgi:hypothetical protein